ncbi:MAG: hypothetical protein H6719_20610 [Sandaracinaceae bacterium]|nr:hypothetical protein [Sandaracinaceae bacterium]
MSTVSDPRDYEEMLRHGIAFDALEHGVRQLLQARFLERLQTLPLVGEQSPGWPRVRAHERVEVYVTTGGERIDEGVVTIAGVFQTSSGVLVAFETGANWTPSTPVTLALTSGERHVRSGMPWQRTFVSLGINESHCEHVRERAQIVSDPRRYLDKIRSQVRDGEVEPFVAIARLSDLTEFLLAERDDAHALAELEQWEEGK